MKKFISFLVFCLIGLSFNSYAQNSLTKVNLILKMDEGKIGSHFFEDFVEADELEKGENLTEALARINKDLSFKLKEGLHKKTNKLRFGEYPDAEYTLKVFFLNSNEDGQRATFAFIVINNQTGEKIQFNKYDGGGTFGHRLNLLGDCLIGVGKKSSKEIEKFIFGK